MRFTPSFFHSTPNEQQELQQYAAFIQGAASALSGRSLLTGDISGAIAWGIVLLVSDQLADIVYHNRDKIKSVAKSVGEDVTNYVKSKFH